MILKLRKLIKKYIFSIYKSIYFPKLKIGSSLEYWGFPKIIIFKNSAIEIGDNFTIISKRYKNPVGLNHAVFISTDCEDARIKIGNDVGMSGGTICAALSITIGNNCMIGANCIIVDTDFHQISPINRRTNSDYNNVKTAPVVIENNVWLSMNVVVLKGVTIGKNTIIGANSVVTKSIPPNVIASGIPARVLKEI